MCYCVLGGVGACGCLYMSDNVAFDGFINECSECRGW